MTTRLAQRLAAGAGALAVVALYSPILDSWFVGDDLEEILGGRGGLGATPTQDLHPGRNLRPLNLFLHGLTQRVFGWNPLPFHLTAVVGHVVASFLVVAMVRSLVRWFGVDGPRHLPVVAGVLFAVAPNHPEAVSWISTRGDVLIVCASTVALWCWCRQERTVAWTLGAVAAYGVALASKEAAIVVPAVVTVFEVARAWAAGRRGRGLVAATRSTWPWWVATLAYVVIRRVALGTVKAGSFREEFVGDSVVGLVRRSGSLVVRTFVPGMTAGWWIVTGVGAAGIGVLAWMQRTDHRVPGARALWLGLAGAIVVAIAPVGHLGASATTVAGERLVYLPSAFGVVLLAWPLCRVAERLGRVGVAVVAAVVVAASSSLFAVNRGWADSARVAESFADQLGQLPPDRPALLLNTPDLVDGVQCMRNALWPSLVVVHGWAPIGPARDVVKVDQAGPRDRVSVRPGPVPRSWRLRLEHPGASIVETVALPGVDVRRVGEREVEVRVEPKADWETVAYFTEGRLVILER